MIEASKYVILLLISIITFKISFEALLAKPGIFLFLTIAAMPLTIVIHFKNSLLILDGRKVRMGLYLIANLVYLLLIGYFLNNDNFLLLSCTYLLLTISLTRICIEFARYPNFY